MAEAALALRDAFSEKLERTIRLAALPAPDLSGKHRVLLMTAQEACPHIPAIGCEQLVRFYFTAALAATQMTPTLGEGIEIEAPSGSGEKVKLILGDSRQIPYGFKPPHSPRFEAPKFPSTGFWLGSAGLEIQQQADLIKTMPSVTRRIGIGHAAATRIPEKVEPFRAFTELKRWLRLNAVQLTELLGIKRTTPNAWKREDRNPRGETAVRLFRLHSYVSQLADRPDGAEQLARLRPALPTLIKAIYAEAAISSETFEAAGIAIPFDWQRINAFQAANRVAITQDEDGQPLGGAPLVEGMLSEEDDNDLELLY